MKVFAVRCEFQMNVLVLACCPLRSSVLRMQVLCVVIQCLKMRYVFIQAFPCNEKRKKIHDHRIKFDFFVLEQERKSANRLLIPRKIRKSSLQLTALLDIAYDGKNRELDIFDNFLQGL